MARRRRAAPPAGLRARRRQPVAQPDRRRGHRPARPAARRRSTSGAGPSCSSASSSTRPRRAAAYSKGNRQKVALVAALASDVELLVLDEPTSGLDPLMEEVFQECVDELPRPRPHRAAVQPHPGRGRGALRPGEHHPGRAARVETGTLAELRHLTRTSVARRARRGPPTGLDAARRASHDLADRRQPGRLRGRHRASSARRWTRSSAAGIRSLTSQPPTLEELFLRHYGDRRRRTPTPDGRAVTAHDRHLAAPAARSCGGTAGCCCGGRSATALLYWSPGRQRRRASTRPRPSSTGAAASMADNAALHRHGRPGPGAQHGRRAGRPGRHGVRGDRRGPDEHVPRRAAHPRRGGVRPRRAAPGGRRRARGPDWPRPSWSALVANVLVGGPGRGQPRAPYALAVADSVALGVGLAAVRAGLHRHRRWWPRSSPPAPGRRTASPARSSASPTCCAPSATSAPPCLTWLSPIGWYQAMHAFSGLRWWPAALAGGRGGAGRGRCARGLRTPRRRRRRAGRRGRARPRAAPLLGPRAAWPGGCSAAPCSAGRSGMALVGLALRLDRRRRRRPARRQRGHAATCSPRASGGIVDALLRHGDR